MSEPELADLLYLFDRVNEPVYFPKGEPGRKCYLEVSTNYLAPEYQDKGVILLNQFNSDTDARRVQVGELDNALMRIPLDMVVRVRRNEPFSPFNVLHRKAADYLIKVFLGLRNFRDLLRFAAYVHDRINAELFVYTLAIAMMHRDDTKNLRIPQEVEILPELFIDNNKISEARREAIVLEADSEPVRIEVSRNFTEVNGTIEDRLLYFREDVGLNLHHWHWHLIHPFGGPESIVKKDRRGELFYHAHHQIIARYNIERHCNDMNLVKRLVNWDEPIEEAYFSNLDTAVSGREYASRAPNMVMADLRRPEEQIYIDIDDMRRWRDRIYEAIAAKKVTANDGTEIDLNNDAGIDILGDIIEASILNPNISYYGDLHNAGHLVIAYIHDPVYEYTQDFGVMANVATALRDPVFYRWHSYIDDIFNEHKKTLGPYDTQFLDFPEIKVKSIELCSHEGQEECKGDKNVLNTHWMKNDIDLSRGLDFSPHEPIFATFTHLNHDNFTYTIEVENTSSENLIGTVRIFMAPVRRFENDGITLEEQRLLMIEMDKFATILKPGNNEIKRESSDSSIVIPFHQIFRDLDTDRPADDDENFDAFNFCGCGWPEYLLVPKGTTEGYQMVLFVMISDYKQDKIDEPGQIEPGCKTGVSFCGLRNSKFPDKKPMGFPFDRPIDNDTLDEFLLSNMSTTKVTILHTNVVKEG